MKNNNKLKIVIYIVGIILLTMTGVSYAFFSFNQASTSSSEIVTGEIYMNYIESNEIALNNVFPMKKSDAILSNDNVFNFTINGKNTSDKDLSYGISLSNGSQLEGKTRFNLEHIMVYLTCDDVVLLDGVRYSEWNAGKIWIDTIPAYTNSPIDKHYSLRVWIDEEVTIGDGVNADYTSLDWNNSYATIKVNVDGNLGDMVMPLTILTSDSYVENGKSYFLVKISNFTNLELEGESVTPSDNMNLKIESAGNDTEFSYINDSNELTTLSDSLDLNYVFNTNKSKEVKVFITPKNDANSNNDIRIKLSQNGNLIQSIVKRIYVKGNNYCLNNGFNKLKDCILVMDSQATNVVDAISSVEAKGQVDVNNIAPTYDSEGNINGGDLGLYAQEDDYGTSYFYRGAVTNNNVKFAGFYWKIIRINGDGSIRLIYNGSTSGATGNATGINGTTYPYNLKYPDPTYVGYMYGDNLVSQESLETDYYNIKNATTSYVFAKNYDIVPGTINYVLRDDPDDATDTITKTFSEMNAMMEDGGTDNFFTVYPYTCMETSSSTKCQVIIKASSYNEPLYYAKATYTSFSSTSADNTRLNNASSNIKKQLETWYQNNILKKNDANGNFYSKYVTDQTFCNDRSMPNSSYNSGYLRNIHTYYGGYQRLANDAVKTAELTCNGDIRDTFSVTNTKGNGLLTYPVGLITADEVALAGIKYGSANANPNNYLTTGGNFWTMTPSLFYSQYTYAFVYNVGPTGYLYGSYGVTNGLGARAVINLSPNIVMVSGNGTSETPYEVKLK